MSDMAIYHQLTTQLVSFRIAEYSAAEIRQRLGVSPLRIQNRSQLVPREGFIPAILKGVEEIPWTERNADAGLWGVFNGAPRMR
jgi:hypothetical protein